MKSKKSFDKLRGGYYTPQAITEFICKWIINKNTKNILEPSCGDGNFLKAIVERQEKLNLNLDITGVELCLDEAKKAMRYGTNVECQDFFAFYRDKVTGKSNYDAIVGNPPFIRYQDFDEKSRDIAFFYMKENGFHPTKLTNIWLPFLILSCLALSENGRLGMVIPAELFQVNYAGETREFLARYFDRLTLITFQKLVKSDFVLAAGLITFITVFLMIFSMKYYMKLRIKDYTTFIVLGMKKKTSYLLLLVEYTVGCVFSLVFGILMGNGILYGAQTALHKLYPEFLKVTAPGWKIYRNTCGMSVANMTGVFLILLVWMDGRNLSTLISKSEYNEKRPVGKKWILMVLIGIGVLVLGENQYQGSDLSYMYSHVIFIVGLFLVAAFGVALILEGLKHRKQFYHRHILQMNQLYSKYMNNLLILLILLVIHFFALTYLTVEIAEVLPLDKYRENYPYDMVWMAKEEDEAFAEKLVRKYDGNMTELPMIRVTTYYGAQHIGVSASEYEKLTGKDVNLSEREILVGIEDSEYQKEKKITDEDYLNTYSFLFTGKYQEDMAEISHTDPQYLYDIKDIFTQNVIGQYSTDQWHENIIVFSDTYFQKQWEAMRGDDQEATVLRLFTFSGKRKENAWKELSEYQKECGVKNDSDTRMESYLYGTEEYLIGQKMRVLFSLSSKLFLMMALFISAFFVNGIKILSELSGYERRYEFLRCMGMKQKQRRKTIRFETQMLSDIALFATVMMGIVYVLSYEWRCASKDAGSLDVTFWMYWILIVGIYLLADRLVQWLFAQYVIKRVEKGND